MGKVRGPSYLKRCWGTYRSCMGSTTAPPSSPEWRSGFSLVIYHIFVKEFERWYELTYLYVRVHDATQAVRDAGLVLRYPRRVADQNRIDMANEGLQPNIIHPLFAIIFQKNSPNAS